MSRQYRVRVRETLRRVIKAEDCVRSQLELLEILPADQMADLLAQELARRGFEQQDQRLVRKQGDVEVTVDLPTGTVSVRVATEQEVQLEGERSGWTYNDAGPSKRAVKKQLGEQIRQALEKDAEKHRGALQQSVTDRLERELGDVATELDQAVNRATAEALKRKAAQLGRIKQLADDPQTGSLTIVVEV